MKIALDAVGGDYYPQNPVIGAIEAVKERKDLTVVLFGPGEMIQKELALQGGSERIEVFNAPDIIEMGETPAKAVKNKPNSSIVTGLSMHKKGAVDGFVSAGNTGALMAASTFILGRLKGILRPSIGTFFPSLNKMGLIIDAGANLDPKPAMMFQFGIMGKIFAKDIMGIKEPKIGLLNVGEEKEKGSDWLKESYKQLESLPGFIGNVEGRDILTGKANVYLCDGVTGNILLKFGESIPALIASLFKEAIRKKELDAQTTTLLNSLLKEVFTPFDYQRIGGVPFLGIDGVSMVGHGGSTPLAIKNMILNSVKMAEKEINKKIIASLA